MPYEKSNLTRAKELRRNMTPWERKLWHCFLKTYPIRFQRQKCIGNYIADFYCYQAKLVVELDGGGHYTPGHSFYDRIRTEDLEKTGFKVIRFCNLDVDRNFYGVCPVIDMEVKSRTGKV